MITKGAHHVSLTVSDLDQACAFYGGLLGLAEIERPDFGFPGAWYQAGSVQLHLITAPPGHDIGSTPARTTPLANHLAFEIEDYEAMKARLEDAGIDVIGLGDEAGQLFAPDPHGNMIEFIRPGGRLGRAKSE